MLQLQFLLVNAHFTLFLLGALVCFAVTWLYFDAWTGRHDVKESTKALGFFLLTLSFLVESTIVEQSLLSHSLLGSGVTDSFIAITRVSAYLVLIVGQLIDPLQPLPTYRFKDSAAAIMIAGVPLFDSFLFVYPLLAMITSFLYIRRATVGLEFHLRTIGYSFALLSVSELFGVAESFRDAANPFIAQLAAPFGIFWIGKHIFLLIYMFVIGRWVWGYLAKRLETQLFIVFNTVTLTVFLLTAIFFTSVSLNNLRNDILSNLETNVKVLQYTIDSKKAETLSDSQVIAQNPEVVQGIIDNNTSDLGEVASSLLLTKKQDYLVIVNKDGGVLARGDDPGKIGGSLSDDPLIKKALEGESASGVVVTDSVMAPIVSVRAASTITTSEGVSGAVMIGTAIDNTFVDSLKDATGLEASVYADNIRSATTFVAPDGKSRYIGIKEENPDVRKMVLVDAQTYTDSVSILNIAYLSALSPLRNVDDVVVGMLFVGRPEVETLQAAGELIEQTFLVTVVLLVLSILPSYLVSKYIIAQVR